MHSGTSGSSHGALTSRLRRLAMALLAGTLLLGACAPAATPTPTPGPVPRIAATPWFAPRVLAWARTYREAYGPLPFDVEVVHAAAAIDGLQRGVYVLAIGALEPAEGWFATPLGVEAMGVVAGSGSGVQQVTREQLITLLAGRTANWSMLGGRDQAVQPILPLPGDDARSRIEEALMQGASFASAARLTATPEQALDLLDAEPGALLILPMSALPDSLTALSIDGTLPPTDPSNAAGYPLVATLAAIGPEEPAGAVRDWLVWVQSQQLP
jgi:ABC-type phosphate transport system substrate-binding protein